MDPNLIEDRLAEQPVAREVFPPLAELRKRLARAKGIATPAEQTATTLAEAAALEWWRPMSPQLWRSGLVTWGIDRGIVTSADRFRVLDAIIEAMR